MAAARDDIAPEFSDLAARGLMVGGAVHPFLYLVTPDGAHDSWLVWTAAGAVMALPGLGVFFSERIRRHQRTLARLAIYTLAAQFFALATLNHMHPLYAIGSILIAMDPVLLIFTTRKSFVLYMSYIFSLAFAGYVYQPDPLMLAYWGTLFIVFPVLYLSLQRRLRAEAEIARYQTRLEHLVEERTGELSARSSDLAATNQRLHHEIRERERAEEKLRVLQKLEALSRLAGGVAHDFNNFLTAIRGFAELLRQKLPEKSSERSDADEICRTTERAAELTGQLLSFSRQNALEVAPLELDAVVRDAASMLDAVVGDDIELELELGASGAWILANRSQIDQVLVNLIVNARDAMPRGGVVAISTVFLRRDVDGENFSDEIDTDAGEIVQIQVRDTGVGMDADTRGRIFDPFFTTKDVSEGSGLGLAAVYGIVQQSGGAIRVESAVGRGSCFEVQWPRVDTPTGEVDLHDTVSPEPPAPLSVEGRHILLVEDDPSLRRLMCRVLESEGHVVHTVANASEALAYVEDASRPLDLMVTDVVMPRVSGIELAQQVLVCRPGTPILFVSGHLNHPSLGSGSLPQHSRLLAKPFPPEVLMSRVREALQPDDPGAVKAGSARRFPPATASPERVAPFPSGTPG